MLNQEAPKLWLDAINAAEATIHSFPVSLFHLLTIQEPPGQDRGRGRRVSRQQDSSPTPSRSRTPAPQILVLPSPTPAPPYPYHPAMAQHQWHLPPARGSSPPIPEVPQDLIAYLEWYKLREPINLPSIEQVAAALEDGKDTLSTLATMTESRVLSSGLPAGLVERMKAGIRTWRKVTG